MTTMMDMYSQVPNLEELFGLTHVPQSPQQPLVVPRHSLPAVTVPPATVPASPPPGQAELDTAFFEQFLYSNNLPSEHTAKQHPQPFPFNATDLTDDHFEVLTSSPAITDMSDTHSEVTMDMDVVSVKQEPPTLGEDDDVPGTPSPDDHDPKPRVDGDGEFSVITPAKGKPLYGTPADASDRQIQKLFPEWTLRLERNEFTRWRKKAGIRSLTPRENDTLKRYRRTMLARVYADRARHRRQAKHGNAEATIGKLTSENKRLRKQVEMLQKQLLSR